MTTVGQTGWLQAVIPQGLRNIADTAYLTLKSPLVLTFGSIFATGYFLPAKAVMCILGGVVGAMIYFPEKIPKGLFYEGVIVDNLARSVLTRCKLLRSPYYSHMGDNIYVGTIPLQNLDHDKMIQQLGVKAILMIVEDYELNQRTFLSEAVQKQVWIDAGMDVLQIPVVDLNSIPLEALHQAADFINQYKEEGIYDHCKAGRGRSIMAFIAFLMKHKHMDLEKAFIYAHSKRSSANLKPWQYERLREFQKDLKIQKAE